MTLLEIKQDAVLHNIPFVDDVVLEFMKGVVQSNKFTQILEIGSGNGYSALALYQFTQGKVTTIEKSLDSFQHCKENLKNFDSIHCLHGDAKEILLRLADEDKKFDFVFVDANKWEYWDYFRRSEPLLQKKGIMIFDNVLLMKQTFLQKKNYVMLKQNMSEFRKKVYQNKKYKIKLLNIGDGVFLLKKIKF